MNSELSLVSECITVPHGTKVKAGHYADAISTILEKIVVRRDCSLDQLIDNKNISLGLPVITWESRLGEPLGLSVMMFCVYKTNAARFFFDMVSRWLAPGKKLMPELFFGSDFHFSTRPETYLVAEVLLRPESLQDLEVLERNLVLMQPELKMGLDSAFHAKRILEIKGLAADEKTSVIQGRIARFVQIRPAVFDYEIFAQMQHFLVLCKGEFKALRSCDHLARIVFIFYFFRRQMRNLVQNFSGRRHILVKVMRVKIASLSHSSRALAIWACINHFNEAELFDQKHLLKAVPALSQAQR